MIDHMGIKCSNFARSKSFYEQALAPIGLSIVMEVTKEQSGGYEGCGLGQNGKPGFWISPAPESDPRSIRSIHVAFLAPNRQAVDAFHAAALKAGGRDNGPPGLRAHYHPNYYGAFVLDPDGHNIEAVCHAPEGI